jgi:hypothetical protein
VLAVGSLSGASSLAATGAAASAGVGALSGASALAGVGKSTVSAVGSLSGASSLIGVNGAVNNGSLSGASALAGVGASKFTAIGALAGASALAATGRSTIIGDGSVVGATSLAAIGLATASAVGSLSGATALDASSRGPRISIIVGAGSFTPIIQAVGSAPSAVANDLMYAQVVLASAPWGYWQIDETGPVVGSKQALDSSGNDHHGLYAGDIILEKPGLVHDGATAGAFATISGSAKLSNFGNPPLVNELSIEAWVQPIDLPFVDVKTLFWSTGAQLLLMPTSPVPDGRAFVAWMTNEWTVEAGEDVNVLTEIDGGIIEPGRIYHVVGVRSAIGRSIYVNGVLVSDEARATTWDPINLCQWGSTRGVGLDVVGVLDNLAIYARALSAAEVLAHYQAAAAVSLAGGGSSTTTIIGTGSTKSIEVV